MKRMLIMAAYLVTAAASLHAQSDWSHITMNDVVSIDSFTQQQYTLVFINKDAAFDKRTGKRMTDAFFKVYPAQAALYNPATARRVVFVIDPAYKGVAATLGTIVRYSPGWMREHPDDIDVVTHEVMHIVQGYPGNAGPGWITEGIADYVRATLGIDNKAAGWSLPAFNEKQHYENAYRVTARFFLWIEQQHTGFVKALDAAMRTRSYTAAFWQQHTGKSVDELWKAYAQQQSGKGLLLYVKPLTGTARMGHTYPGATAPFGMVQLSPDTDTISYEKAGGYNKDVYQYCAGYQYEDKTIVGFSHTHFSGTGHADLGDFLVMPTTGPLQLNPGTADHPEAGYRSAFSHENETAEAAYYKVLLDDHHITAELTATNRVGFHRYTFPASGDAHIILDLMHGIYNYPGKNIWTFVRVENDTLVTGYRQTNGWGRTRTVYFAMSFSKPFKQYGCKDYSEKQVYRGFWRKFDQGRNWPELAGKELRMYFDFSTTQDEQVLVKFALSPVSTEGALLNLRTEIPHWNFDQVKRESQQAWEKELAKVTITTRDTETKEIFYTSLYHTFITPTTYMDVDGRYKGLDQNIHKAAGTNYTTFSLWDTYRALHPFFNLVQPARNADMMRSMLAHYDQSSLHMLPVWSHYANENWCMTGYHAVSLLADAVVKGNAPFDANKALDACVTTATNRWYEGLGDYIDKGYVPEDKSGASVSKTLEYAYDDWAIAQMAKKLQRSAVYETFSRRAAFYRNVFDASTGFMRPRLNNGSFRPQFDPLDTEGQGFIEGNAWNYSLYVPQDPAAMITLMGGKKRFTAHLDSLFTMTLPDKYFEHTEDITRDGIIGNYVHGNEPSHHVAYLYNWTDEPWKTQERVRMILKHQYHTGPSGLGGNDDCGQMSAWYIFSSLGFYPVAPGSEDYALGSPAIEKAVIQLENGGSFTVEAKNQGDANVFVKQVLLNGKPYTKRFISHSDIVKGGHLLFVMDSRP